MTDYCENHTEGKNTLYDKMYSFNNIKAGGMYSHHCSLFKSCNGCEHAMQAFVCKPGMQICRSLRLGSLLTQAMSVMPPLHLEVAQ
jgi:hypothetical protein